MMFWPFRHCLFLSTLSLRRATVDALKLADAMLFLSTLSLRRATLLSTQSNHNFAGFYPRSPCGERPTTTITICIVSKFLSTLSLRRATQAQLLKIVPHGVSIHALLAESDETQKPKPTRQNQFLSTLSLRRATSQSSAKSTPAEVSIHALLAESDSTTTITICIASKFLSTLSLRRATNGHDQAPYRVAFLSTLSLRRATRGGHVGKSRSKRFYPRSPCGERQR